MKNSKILHCLSRLDDGLSSYLCSRLIAELGPKLVHTIVTSTRDTDAKRHGLRAHFPADFPQMGGKPTPGRLLKLAQAMAPYDLVLTYDYGALNVAMAHTAFSQAFGLPPLIHHEFGFGEGGNRELTARRNWYRRIALGRAAGLVVPSERLEGLALTTWQQPIGRVKHISPGVEVQHQPKKVASDALRGLIKRDGEQWIGTLGDAGDLNDWRHIFDALAQLPQSWQLIIAGEGKTLAAIRAKAQDMELSHRVHFPGAIDNPDILLGLLDIYLDLETGDTFPFNSLKAMGAGLPVVGILSGDLGQLMNGASAEDLARSANRDSLQSSLVALAQDPLDRTRSGERNREIVKQAFTDAAMIDRFRRLYASALGREL